jgi:hypothetical protein
MNFDAAPKQNKSRKFTLLPEEEEKIRREAKLAEVNSDDAVKKALDKIEEANKRIEENEIDNVARDFLERLAEKRNAEDARKKGGGFQKQKRAQG